MKIYLVIIFSLLVIVQSPAQCSKGKKTKGVNTNVNQDVTFKNLPDGADLSDEVRIDKFNDEGELISYEVISVKEKLRQIGAKYIDNILVDKNDRAIRFYKPPIRGASQGFEEDRKQQKLDAKELEELKEKYTVIEIFVNPLKVM